jgi:hypothetical protein
VEPERISVQSIENKIKSNLNKNYGCLEICHPEAQNPKNLLWQKRHTRHSGASLGLRAVDRDKVCSTLFMIPSVTSQDRRLTS